MKLSIPLYGQRDARWSRKRLGNSTLTIGSDGCLLCAHAMMMTYYGHECTPDVLNEIYKSKGVFDGALINFYAAGNVYGDVNCVEFYNCEDVPCDLSKIDLQLSRKQPVIAWVDNVNDDNKPDHFVLITGKTDDGHYITADPWTGEEYFFDAKWGDPSAKIYGLRIYNGTPKIEINYQDKINELTTQLASTNQALAEKSAEVARLIQDLAIQEKDNADQLQEFLRIKGERDTAVYEREQLKNKVASLEAELANAKNENELLKKRIEILEEDGVKALTRFDLFRMWLFYRPTKA